MDSSVKVVVVLLLLLGFVALAALSSLVGGIAIRTVGQSERVSVFELPDALLPGVPATIPVTSLGLVGDVTVALRTSEDTFTIAHELTHTLQGDLVVILPCGIPPADEVTVVLLDPVTRQVLAHSQNTVQILPPGPDCFF